MTTLKSWRRDRSKRWRIPATVANRHINLLPDELASLDIAVKRFSGDGMALHVKHLKSLTNKIKSLQRGHDAHKVETDLEALIEAEGLATRPGPRPRISVEHLHTLREAIKSCRIVELLYRAKGKTEAEIKRISPYGFLYGHRHYLIGGGTEKGREAARYHFTLSQIEGVTITKQSFRRDPHFNLQSYAEESFGIWREKPVEVVWRFTPRVAKAARDFVFHPSQKNVDGKDGSLTVRFKAGGLLEMAWHLYKWGDQVEVLKPVGLRKMVGDYARKWEGLP